MSGERYTPSTMPNESDARYEARMGPDAPASPAPGAGEASRRYEMGVGYAPSPAPSAPPDESERERLAAWLEEIHADDEVGAKYARAAALLRSPAEARDDMMGAAAHVHRICDEAGIPDEHPDGGGFADVVTRVRWLAARSPAESERAEELSATRELLEANRASVRAVCVALTEAGAPLHLPSDEAVRWLAAQRDEARALFKDANERLAEIIVGLPTEEEVDDMLAARSVPTGPGDATDPLTPTRCATGDYMVTGVPEPLLGRSKGAWIGYDALRRLEDSAPTGPSEPWPNDEIAALKAAAYFRSAGMRHEIATAATDVSREYQAESDALRRAIARLEQDSVPTGTPGEPREPVGYVSSLDLDDLSRGTKDRAIDALARLERGAPAGPTDGGGAV